MAHMKGVFRSRHCLFYEGSHVYPFSIPMFWRHYVKMSYFLGFKMVAGTGHERWTYQLTTIPIEGSRILDTRLKIECYVRANT
jgi:hypothetical protein